MFGGRIFIFIFNLFFLTGRTADHSVIKRISGFIWGGIRMTGRQQALPEWGENVNSPAASHRCGGGGAGGGVGTFVHDAFAFSHRTGQGASRVIA